MRSIAFTTLVLNGLLAPYANGARFEPLGFLPGAKFGTFSEANDISADGTVIVGVSSSANGSNGQEAFRWTETEGMIGLGEFTLVERFAENAAAISGDSNTIAGTIDQGRGPFVWTATTGFEFISIRTAIPSALSYDGTVVAGNAATGAPRVFDVSWNGSVTVGRDAGEAFREEAGFREYLGDLPGGLFESSARAVSPDGLMIVGEGSTQTHVHDELLVTSRAFRWTRNGGLVGLEGWFSSDAKDISLSKLVIAGDGQRESGEPRDSFRWTPSRGMESVTDLLLDSSVNLAALGWSELSLNRMSADGRIFVGSGLNGGQQQAVLIEINVPGDFDEDGDSDGHDFLEWQRGFGTTYDNSDLADWNANLDYLKTIVESPIATIAVPELPASRLFVLAVLSIIAAARCQQKAIPRRTFFLWMSASASAFPRCSKISAMPNVAAR